MHMGTEEVINFSDLLTPIPGERPTGSDPREDVAPTAPYRALKDTRTEVRAAERKLQNGDSQEGGEPDWKPIVDLARRLLGEQAKDLEVAAWLAEGLTREYGFAGLRDGFRLARELVEKFWDTLFPMPDEEGVGNRVAALGALDGTVPLWVNTMPLTDGQSSGPFSWFHYQQAVEVEQTTDPDKRRTRLERGAVPMEQFKLAVAETPAAFYHDLTADIASCLEEMGKLSAALDSRCGAEVSPSFADLRKALQACLETVQIVAKDKLESVAEPAGSEGEAAAAESPRDGGSRVGVASAMGGAIRSREDAFREIMKIASYFKQTEPQSLMWYALEQVVRWGRMPLPDLLAEFVPDEGRTRFGWLGIKAKSETEGEKPQSSDQG
jgi:type VI secretion system protein ImpA